MVIATGETREAAQRAAAAALSTNRIVVQ